MPPQVLSISGDVLHRSHAIWTNRVFITVKENDDAFRAIETLADSLSVSEIAKSNAIQTCIETIKAYGRGDWDAFLSMRVPYPDYGLNSQEVKNLEREAKRHGVANIPEVTTQNILDLYHLIWKDLVATNGLFSEVSFITNSLTVVETSPNRLAEVRPPSFTEKTNDNYMTLNSRSILDYSAKLSAQKSQKIKALRFFFFSKEGKESDFYMFIFVFDEQNEAWIPWYLSVGFTGAPSHGLLDCY